MKKILLFFILFIPVTVNASIVVSDADTGRILYNVGGSEKKLIASTTKIMTSLVVINNVNLKDIITVDQSVLKSFGSGIYVSIGEKISVEDLLYGLLLRSGNDAAILLEEHVGGSEEGFAKLMNELALSIGMKDTNFINGSGLENEMGLGNTSTAIDMAKLMNYAITNKKFVQISSTPHKIVKTNMKTYDWHNKNKLLSMYKYTVAGKTGYTKKAHRTLVTSAKKDNKKLSIVTLDEVDDFNMHKRLYETFFNKYKLINIIDKRTFLKDDGYYVKDNFDMLLLDNEIDKIKVNVNYTDDAIDRAGIVTVTLNDQEYYHENIYKIKKNKKTSFFAKIKKMISKLFQ